MPRAEFQTDRASAERLIARLHPSTFVSPLQSTFALILRPSPFGAGDLPGFLPSSRHDQGASTDRETSQAPLRAVHRRSQPPDGLLRTLAPGLVSSPSRVQGASRSGGSLSAQRYRLVAGSCPLAVATADARRTLRVRRPHRPCLDLEAFLRAEARARHPGDQPGRRSLPSSGSRLLQARHPSGPEAGLPSFGRS